MEVERAIKGRRSVRHFLPDPIPEEHLLEILEAACRAPSACNRASWEAVVVTEEETKKRLSQAAINQTFVSEAPVVLAFVGGSVADVAASIQNALLVAHSRGYEGCWTGSMRAEEVARILGLPEGMKVQYLVPLGKPAEPLFDPGKRSPFEVAHFERYGRRLEGQIEAALKALREDTSRALDEFLKAHRLTKEEAERTGYLDPLLRMEEKGAAFSFQHLVGRWNRVWEEWLSERLSQAEEQARRSKEAYRRYWEGRSKYLAKGDINDPDLVEHERKYALEIFPQVLRGWLEAVEQAAI